MKLPPRINVGSKVVAKFPMRPFFNKVGTVCKINGGYFYVQYSDLNVAEFYFDELELAPTANDILKGML